MQIPFWYAPKVREVSLHSIHISKGLRRTPCCGHFLFIVSCKLFFLDLKNLLNYLCLFIQPPLPCLHPSMNVHCSHISCLIIHGCSMVYLSSFAELFPCAWKWFSLPDLVGLENYESCFRTLWNCPAPLAKSSPKSLLVFLHPLWPCRLHTLWEHFPCNGDCGAIVILTSSRPWLLEDRSFIWLILSFQTSGKLPATQ